MTLNLHINHFFILIFFSCTGSIWAQEKKNITSETYDEWNHLERIKQSNSGEIVCYQKMPLEGDGSLYIHHLLKDAKKEFKRGTKAYIHSGEKFVTFTLPPQHDSIRQLKLDKVKKSKFPKDSLGIYWMDLDSVAYFSNVKSYKLSEEGDWLAYLSEKDTRPTPKKKRFCLFCKKKKKTISKTSGTSLYVLNPINGSKKTIHKVKDYRFNKSGTLLAYTVSNKAEADSIQLFILDLEKDVEILSSENKLAISSFHFDEAGEQLIYLSSLDTIKQKNYSLEYWNAKTASSVLLVDSTTSGMPEKSTVSEFYNPRFSKDGSKIFLGTNEINYKAEEDSLLSSEKASVDIWTSEDKRIQPEQLKSLNIDKRKNYLAVYHLQEKKFVQLAGKRMSRVFTMNHGNSTVAIGLDQSTHKRERNWEFPWKTDYYLLHLKTGKKEVLKKSLAYGGSVSPSANYFMWYNGTDSSWMSKDLSTKKEINLTRHLPTSFASDNNGMPYVAYPERASGWTQLNGEEYYIVKDFYDIWYLHPTDTSKTFCLTEGKGRSDNMRYSLMRTENDSLYISLDRAVIKGVNDHTKDESLYEVKQSDKGFKLNQLLASNHRIIFFNKADESDRVLIRRSNFTSYPDLEVTSLKFEKIEKITDINPQQSEYNWGTVEFVEWEAYDSTELRGLLYKPENFDSTKKYPMIVYFYEQYQDNIHRYYSPRPTASIVYPTEYVSNGYIIFIPDIRYEPGHPAESAYNCIVSGTEYLTHKYNWIDSTKLGLQGQSWGGYQTAQLVTMTDKYEAAMAGAPVSNMFSAYGGIRWGSGLSRMFQYERTQSRIGYTIWERPDLYIENSPVFGLPKVETPLLIMHNDKDGAVPWYQGIELYMGLRRLDKEVWLLNYNNDAHNLRKLPNKRDLSIRMRQFFDYYLQGEPIPLWMKSGVPAIDKGEETGYELENNKSKN